VRSTHRRRQALQNLCPQKDLADCDRLKAVGLGVRYADDRPLIAWCKSQSACRCIQNCGVVLNRRARRSATRLLLAQSVEGLDAPRGREVARSNETVARNGATTLHILMPVIEMPLENRSV